MVYSTYQFVLLFLPIVLIIYFNLSKMRNDKSQKYFLLISSFLFYGYYNYSYVLILMTSILVNYICAKLMKKRKKYENYFFVFGVLFNILLLGYFKYYNFLIENMNHVLNTTWSTKNILLPLGISFFTFQQISFLISVKHEEEPIGTFLDYSIFVSFFPQLVAGPIVTYKEMINQISDTSKRYFNLPCFCQGIYLFVIGAVKKVVIADTLAILVDNGFAQSDLGFLVSWITALCYTFQIYFDFSGYSDMAIGLGKMFRIELPINFNSPYQSVSVTDFWRRWHITLGKSLSTYIYFPLGGNRKGKMRTVVNLFVTFLVSGVWHGANWTFVLWGCAHGGVVVLERIFEIELGKVPQKIRRVLTFIFVNLAWVLFRAESISEAKKMYLGMINISNIGILQIHDLVFEGLINFPLMIDLVYICCILIVLFIIVSRKRNSMFMIKELNFNTKSAFEVAILSVIVLVCMSRESIFIYFNF